MQKGVCTVYPFFGLRVKPGNKYLNVMYHMQNKQTLDDAFLNNKGET